MRVCVCVCVQTLIAPRPWVARSPNFAYPPKPAYMYLPVPCSKLCDPPKWWKRASSRFSWRKVWNGVKCNFSSPHHQVRKIVGKLSIRRVRMWNFTRIGPKTKKVIPFDNSGSKALWAARLGTTRKRCELPLFLAGIRQAIWRETAIHLGRWNMQF